jgi:hypothetical protein
MKCDFWLGTAPPNDKCGDEAQYNVKLNDDFERHLCEKHFKQRIEELIKHYSPITVTYYKR